MNPPAGSAACAETVTEAGPAAPWIVLVHGVSQDRRVFDRQVAAFRGDHRLLLIDLPGHGLSADLPGPYGIQEYAGSIAEALAAAGIERCHFWGTHIGAGAGLLLACARPALFASLILEGPVFPGRPLPAVAETLARVAATARSDGIAAARTLWWQEGGWFEVMRARPEDCRAAAQRAMIEDFEGRPWLDSGLVSRPIPPIDAALKGLDLPVLIVNGEHDLPDFLAAADALAALLPNCRRSSIPEAGGFPLWEFPEQVNAVVRAFLASS